MSYNAPPNRFNVPLVHKIYDVYKLFHEFLKLFPKSEKYSLGKKIENLILEILETLMKASYSQKQEKLSLLIATDTKINFLKLND